MFDIQLLFQALWEVRVAGNMHSEASYEDVAICPPQASLNATFEGGGIRRS